MQQIRLLLVAMVLGCLFISCNSGSDKDDDGTTGGSGEVVADSVDDSASSNDEKKIDGSVVSDSRIVLDAHVFDCTGNWTLRDGALGLEAYSGSGSCKIAFPGESGNYQLVLKAQTEYDGMSPYKFSINDTQIANGEYPLSSPLGCDCPQDNWRNACPDLKVDIELGVYMLENGDILTFWGDDVYPCGSHGAYAKWHGIEAIKR